MFCRGTRQTGGRRTSGRTGGRADKRTDGRVHCGRGTGRGMRTVRRDPVAAASRAGPAVWNVSLNRNSSAAPTEARAPAAAAAVAAAQCSVHPWSHPPPPPPLTHPPTSLRREQMAGGIISNRPIYGTVAAGSIHEEALTSCHLF